MKLLENPTQTFRVALVISALIHFAGLAVFHVEFGEGFFVRKKIPPVVSSSGVQGYVEVYTRSLDESAAAPFLLPLEDIAAGEDDVLKIKNQVLVWEDMPEPDMKKHVSGNFTKWVTQIPMPSAEIFVRPELPDTSFPDPAGGKVELEIKNFGAKPLMLRSKIPLPRLRGDQRIEAWIYVNALGDPLSCVISNSSGNPELDAQVLELCRSLKFEQKGLEASAVMKMKVILSVKPAFKVANPDAPGTVLQ